MHLTESLRIFARVAELPSFSAAAEQLSLPRTSVSAAVREAEAELGTRLLHRTTRRVQLTQDGQVVYERALDLLAEFTLGVDYGLGSFIGAPSARLDYDFGEYELA